MADLNTRVISEDVESKLRQYTSRSADGQQKLVFAKNWCKDTGIDCTLNNVSSLPIFLESIETLDYIGFTPEMAMQVWKRDLLLREKWSYHGFRRSVLGYLCEAPGVRNCETEEDDWEGEMVKLGISKETRDGILDPGFDRCQVRYTRSMLNWLHYFMTERFEGLEKMDGRLRRVLPLLDGQGRPTVQRDVLQSQFLSRGMSSDVSEVPTRKANHTTLCHAGKLSSLKALYNQENGAFSLSDDKARYVAGSAPGDFEGERRTIYWTTHPAAAGHYARYYQRNLRNEEIGVLRVFMPEKLTDSWTKETLFANGEPTDDWKEIVFASRRGSPWPMEVARGRRDKCDLAIGFIAKGTIGWNERFCLGPDNWQNITDQHVWEVERNNTGGQDCLDTCKRDNRKDEMIRAVQWPLLSSCAIGDFDDACTGLGHIFDSNSWNLFIKQDSKSVRNAQVDSE